MIRRTLNSDYLTSKELEVLGISNAKQRKILIHSTAVIVDFDSITFGNNIRIDPFVVISCSNLVIGSHVHIATGCCIFGRSKITLGDFANLSAQVLVYSSSDDYSGKTMTNPTVPNEYKAVEHAPVTIGRHCILGAKSVVLPGSSLGEGAAIGSSALVKGEISPWTISVGIPARPIKERSKECTLKEKEFLSSRKNNAMTSKVTRKQ